jgi:RNA polymerase sigma-70 factor, ECF subfamily
MQACFSSVFPGTNGNQDAPGRDLELVAAVRAGSNAAFEELESRYSHRLYRRIQSITRNHEDAQDALQETFLRAVLALDSFEGRSQFASWLTRIAINSALMVLRKRRSRAEVSFEPSSESGEAAPTIEARDTALNPEQLYELRQRSECALRAIGKLKINLCTAMTAWIEQESSMTDVARTLDVSLVTVKSRLHRARKQLACSSAFKGSVRNVSSIPASKRGYRIPDSQNREMP